MADRMSIASSRKAAVVEEDEPLEYPYPTSAYYVLVFVFCERFTFNSVQLILQEYLLKGLLLELKQANLMFVIFTVVSYYCSIFGAFLGDSPVGKFNCMIYTSLIYLCGVGILSMSAITTTKKPDKAVTIFGLCLFCLGCGSLKNVLLAFGGDQFILPEQDAHIPLFYAAVYFTLNCAHVAAFIITPFVRDIKCFGKLDCYSLAFGVSAIMMILGILAMVATKPSCNLGKQGYNMTFRIKRCISYARSAKKKNRGPALDHWLDYGKDRYGNKLVEDIKSVGKMLVLFLPFIIYWAALHIESYSSNVQASQMDGDILIWTISAEQMPIAGPLFELFAIPTLYYLIYPGLQKCKLLTTPLQRMTVGGCLAGICLVLSGTVSLVLIRTFPSVPKKDFTQLRIYNTYPCDITIDFPNLSNKPIIIKSGNFYKKLRIKFIPEDGSVTWPYKIHGSCVPERNGFVDLYEETAVGQYFDADGAHLFRDYIGKSISGNPSIRSLINPNGFKSIVEICYIDFFGDVQLKTRSDKTSSTVIDYGLYNVTIDGIMTREVNLQQGAVYALMGYATSATHYRTFLQKVVEPNKLNMLWLVPQYLVLSVSKVMVILTAIEFFYIEAPETMKCLLQMYWMVIHGTGNLMAATFQLTYYSHHRAIAQFASAGILILAMVIFALLAIKYKYKTKRKWYYNK